MSCRLAGPFLDFARVQPGDRVLDVGCGTGVITAALAERGCIVVGVDASEPYLDGARRANGRTPTSSTSSAMHAACGIRAALSTPVSPPWRSTSSQRSTRSQQKCGGSPARAGSWRAACSTFGAGTPPGFGVRHRIRLGRKYPCSPGLHESAASRVGKWTSDVVAQDGTGRRGGGADCPELRLCLVRGLLVELVSRPNQDCPASAGVGDRAARRNRATRSQWLLGRTSRRPAVVCDHRSCGSGYSAAQTRLSPHSPDEAAISSALPKVQG